MDWNWSSVVICILSLSYINHQADALLCVKCDNATSPASCDTLTRCSQGEKCFTDGYSTDNDSHVIFKMGCRSASECLSPNQQSVTSLVGRRSVDGAIECRQCCGLDECNVHLCAADANHKSNTSECVDDQSVDCATTSGFFNLCADIPHAMKVCRKFCGLCEVDGIWTEWTEWSKCDRTCGQGQRTRSRSCTNPPPSNGGDDCAGDGVEADQCSLLEHCPVYGQWSNWTPWGTCSVSCGAGLERRDRTCSNPYPAYGGDSCPGDARDDRVCFAKACADGSWSTWSSWDACSATCGTGLTRRHRQCNNPTPSPLGKQCAGDSTDIQMCDIKSCNEATRQNVAFVAKAVSDTSPGVNTKLIFTQTLVNTDNVYDKTTGDFTAPVAGTYWFSTQLCDTTSYSVHFRIFVNTVQVTDAILIGGHYGCTSSNTVAILNKGDRVYVKTGPNTHSSSYTSITSQIYYWSMFMGSLMN